MIALTDTQKAAIKSFARPIFYVVIVKGSAGNWSDGYSQHLYSQASLLDLIAYTATAYHTAPAATTRYFGDRMTKESIDEAGFSVDAEALGGLAQVGTMKFSIFDHGDHYASLGAAGIYYEGRTVKLYLAFSSTTDGTGDALLWQGIVREVERDYEACTVSFDCETLDVHYDVPAPRFTYPEGFIPEWLVGKPKPLVFGTVPRCPSIQVTAATDQYGPSYVFADVSVGSGGIYSISSPFIYDDGLKSACNGIAYVDQTLSPWVANLTAAMLSVSSVTDNDLHLIIHVPLGDYSAGGATTASITAAEYAKIVDDDAATYTDLTQGYGGSKTLYVKFPQMTSSISASNIAGTSIWRVYPAFKIATAHSSGATASSMTMRVAVFINNNKDLLDTSYRGTRRWIDFGASLSTIAYDIAEGDTSFAFSDDNGTPDYYPDRSLSTLAKYYLGFSLYNYSGGTASMRLYEVRGVTIYGQTDFPQGSALYASVVGYKDDSSGTISGTPNAALNVCTNIAAFIARYVTGAGTAVDFASFAAVRARRPLWRFGRAITETTTSDDLLSSVASEGHFFVWCDSTGKYRAFSADASAATPLRLSRSMAIRGGITSAKETPIRDIANDFTFRYNASPAGGYDGVLTCNATTSSDLLADSVALCSNAADRYTGGRSVSRSFESAWINEQATAVLWATRTIAALTRRRWIVEADLDLEACYLEPGDVVAFVPGEWPSLPSDIAAATFVVAGVKIQPSKDVVSIVLTETI